MKTKSQKIIFVCYILCVMCYVLAAALPALAALVPECDRTVVDAQGRITVDKQCGISDAVGIFITLSDWMVKLLGTVALVFFIYGGFTWLTSAGRPEQITKGQEIITGAIIGIIIVLGAYTAIKFLEESLGVTATFKIK